VLDPGLPPDRIELRGLRFLGCHGALPEEAVRPQPFEVDIDLLADLTAPAAHDELNLTVDYGAVCEVVRSVIEGAHTKLLERLAAEVADRVLAYAGPQADGVVVAVRKLRPPVPFQMASAGVRVQRRARVPGPEPSVVPDAG
jgi:dihydroneopterin aldolase